MLISSLVNNGRERLPAVAAFLLASSVVHGKAGFAITHQIRWVEGSLKPSFTCATLCLYRTIVKNLVSESWRLDGKSTMSICSLVMKKRRIVYAMMLRLA